MPHRSRDRSCRKLPQEPLEAPWTPFQESPAASPSSVPSSPRSSPSSVPSFRPSLSLDLKYLDNRLPLTSSEAAAGSDRHRDFRDFSSDKLTSSLHKQ
ncbi:hypothetical protein L596_009072 [Steinernema carpocapsae]|uniref:Uncharacterized protein n=1 Tax=Steinernema carpocapsae TaxID=34508 RepID=A0A4U5PEB1_STECR|nr:hypothetical protein L596_009072 [Steinernema carpocapsae]